MSSSIHQILQKFWGFEKFRPLQEEIINSVLDGNDTLALLPTGGGKSICFQVPALALEGLCLVISPLIALMRDQVFQLTSHGIKAAAIYSGMSHREIDVTLDNCIYGDMQFLYVSPERLKTEIFLERSSKMRISLVAVDEAHCISQWGYDFRPPYLEIAGFRQLLSGARLIALTASATPDVRKDIVEKLEMRQPRVFEKSFARKNLSYSAFARENKEKKLLEILTNVPGSSIVYVRSRKGTKGLAELLRKEGFSADYYHAGLTSQQRSDKQENWIKNRVRIMTATNAFGMGIDKPDVRSVVHMDLPDSLENYYQEAGRAGRDENKAYAVLLFNQTDIKELQDHLDAAFPPIEEIRRCYQSLANYFKLAVGSNLMTTVDFIIEDFCSSAGFNPYRAYILLTKLQEEGLIELTETFFQPSRIFIPVERKELYDFQVRHQNLDDLVKGILRLYGGEVFTHFIDIEEYQLARHLGIEKKLVIKNLELLEQRGIIRYEQRKDTPQITFLTERLDATKLIIDQKKIMERKRVKKNKLDSMVKYALALDQCRTRLLQEYFGEAVYEDCGNCDYCVRRKRKKKSSDELRKKIIEILSDGSQGLDHLHGVLPGVTEDDLIGVVRDLLDEEKLIYSKTGKLELKKI